MFLLACPLYFSKITPKIRPKMIENAAQFLGNNCNKIAFILVDMVICRCVHVHIDRKSEIWMKTEKWQDSCLIVSPKKCPSTSCMR